MAFYSPARHVVVIERERRTQLRLAAMSCRVFPGAIVHWFTTVRDAEARARGLRNVVLAMINMDLPGQQTVDVLASFKAKFPQAPTVVISARRDRTFIADLLAAGAAGYLPSTHSSRVKVAALRLVALGEIYLPREAISELAAPLPMPDSQEAIAQQLTQRRRDVLRALLKGHNNARIAVELNITRGTTKQHVHAVFKALGVSTRAQLFALAARGGVRHDRSPITEVI